MARRTARRPRATRVSLTAYRGRMWPTACSCDHGAPLCDYCIADSLRYLGGTARARGANRAQAISRVIPLDRPWPATTDRIRAMARRKVAGLTSDERLHDW